MTVFLQTMVALLCTTVSVQSAYRKADLEGFATFNTIKTNADIGLEGSAEQALEEAPACPAGWENKFGKCYLPTPEKKDYADCLSHCTSLEASLPCVMDAAESLYLLGLFPHDLEFCAFIGYNDIVLEGVYKWQEGCASTFTYFIPGEPNNYHDEDCVSVCLRGDRKWNDLPCSFETYCVCERAEGIPAPVVAPPPPATVVASCPEGWESKFGKCYLATLPKQNYTSCLSTCTSLEATLPCVMSAEESLYLAGLSPPNDMQFCAFLGLNDIVTEGDYKWQEGCASTFTYFLPGEPNDYNAWEDCVSVCFGGRKKWNDMPCGANTHCVCEKSGDLDTPVITSPTWVLATVPACPEGWKSKFGKCYLTTNPKKSYADCLSHCSSLEATLPCVMNSEENAYLSALYSTQGHVPVYLGINDLVTEGTFQWQEGCLSTYTNWEAGESNDGQGVEDCTMVYTNNKTGWNDLVCADVEYCVCEKPAPLPSPEQQLQCTCADCSSHYSAGQPRAAHACSFYCYNNC